MITISWTDSGGVDRMATETGTCAPAPGYTREDMWEILYGRAVKDAGAEDALVLFFSLEPNDLHAARDAGTPCPSSGGEDHKP